MCSCLLTFSLHPCLLHSQVHPLPPPPPLPFLTEFSFLILGSGSLTLRWLFSPSCLEFLLTLCCSGQYGSLSAHSHFTHHSPHQHAPLIPNPIASVSTLLPRLFPPIFYKRLVPWIQCFQSCPHPSLNIADHEIYLQLTFVKCHLPPHHLNSY